MSVTSLFNVQVGKETTWGTAVAQTAKLMGVKSLTPTPLVNTKLFKHLRGSLQPAFEAMLTAVGGAYTLEETGLYEDIIFGLESLLHIATPTGAGPYTRPYAAPTTSQPTRRFETLCQGQGSDIYSLLGAITTSMTLKATAGENDTEMTVTRELIGQKFAEDTVDALSDRTVNPIMASHFACYMDAWAGTMGATALTATVKGFELALMAPVLLKRYLGSLAPGGLEFPEWKPSDNKLKLSLEFNSTVNSIVDSILGVSGVVQRQIRLKASDTANRDLQLDFAGTIVGAPQIFRDEDGLVMIDLEFEGTYNSGLANFFKATLINGLATVP